jgi:hypothetical protein
MGWSDLVLVLSSWLTMIHVLINSFVLIFSCGHDLLKHEVEYLISQITNAFTLASTKTKTTAVLMLSIVEFRLMKLRHPLVHLPLLLVKQLDFDMLCLKNMNLIIFWLL